MAKYFCVMFLSSLLLMSPLTTIHANSHPPPSIDAIYQFGDSISDTGNLIRDNPTGEHSNFAKLPYGETFFHKPTGRCSDGRLMIDFFAKLLKLPMLDPYLKKGGGKFSHGVNFAVAGSTALDTYTLGTKNIISPVTSSSLSVQLSWFKAHLQSICSNPSECKAKLAKALVLMGEIGGNDYNYAFFQRKTMQDLYQMVPEVVQTIKSAAEEVIGLGATRVVVPGNFPIGCMPIYLTAFRTNDLSMYDKLKCLTYLNDFAKFHNDHLQQAIRELQREHPNVAVIYGDYFSAMKGILQHASSLGFDANAVQKACCGTGDEDYNFNMTRMCGSDGVSVCEDPYRRVSWDGIHLTQHAYHVMARSLMKTILRGISKAA